AARGYRDILSSVLLTAGDPQRLLERELACIQGLTDDRGVHALVDDGGVGSDVVQAGDTTRRDDRRGRRRGNLAQQLDIRAVQHAVTGDIGDNQAGHALGVEALEDLPQVAAVAGPATAAQAPLTVDLTGVQADSDLISVLLDDLLAPFRVLQRGGSDVHPLASGGQGALEGGVVADAAGELDLQVHCLGDLADDLEVATSAEGGIEVDEVNPLGPGVLPGHGGLDRRAVAGLRAGLALDEADGLALGDVDGGKESQSGGVVVGHVFHFLATGWI